MSTLGERIKAARIKSGMTQEQLAAVLDTTKAAVSRYEAGKREPNLHQLSKIAIATKTTVSELVEDGYWAQVQKYEFEASFSDNPQQVILCGLFEQLNEIGQQKAIERLEDLLEVAKYRK
jgi:transcriptional regulator with XRE-family HTH domain